MTAGTASRLNEQVAALYRERTPQSQALFQKAQSVFPSGITHDNRHLNPYPIYMSRASGSRKWDVDGNEYVDYIGGHGALLLGHNDPDVTAAVHDQVQVGAHYGASHPLEVAWGEQIQRLVPSAERVRFTNSGTEATLLGLRLARAFTGRSKFLRFKGHFHGWHDHMTTGHVSHFDGTPTIGVLPDIARNVVVAPSDDIARTCDMLESDRDIAAVIIEPTGSTFGRAPIDASFIRQLRDTTTRLGIVLIFDEVVTGFRVSPGGAQALLGITPDLTALAKIMAGGFPGGAIVGRKDLLDALDFEEMKSRKKEKITHQGTFNANPISAAAGVAALKKIADGSAGERASQYAEKLRRALNEVFEEDRVSWAAYGEFSALHIFTNRQGRTISPTTFEAHAVSHDELRANDPVLVNALRVALLNNGVDIGGWPGGPVSSVHGPEDLDRTVAAFRESTRALRREGLC